MESPTASGTSGTSRLSRSQKTNASGDGSGSSGKVSSGLPWAGSVWNARVLFMVCLGGTAVALAVLAKHFMDVSERQLAENQFSSMANRSLFWAEQITLRRKMGSVSMASIYGHRFPAADRDWPNVVLEGFEEMAQHILSTSAADFGFMGFLPLVTLPQRQAFEQFAYAHFEETYPPGTGIMPGGQRGIYFRNYAADDANITDFWSQYTTNFTSWGSPNRIMTPMFQVVGPSGTNVLMFNFHSLRDRGDLIDDVLECARLRAQKNDSDTLMSCSSISDIIFITRNPALAYMGPGAVMWEPIYPAHDPTEVVGFITTSMYWRDVLQQVFVEEAEGIYCVLSSPTATFTYLVTRGAVEYLGEGDMHERKYSANGQTITLTSENQFTPNSAPISLAIFPSDKFMESYSTRNPSLSAIGAIAIVIFTSLVFLLYDSVVRKAFHEKQAVLEAKREFIRFVSHEVRTPLNTVVMGLRLMQDEVEKLVTTVTNYDNNSNPTSYILDGSHHEPNPILPHGDTMKTLPLSATGSATTDSTADSTATPPMHHHHQPLVSARSQRHLRRFDCQEFMDLSRSVMESAESAVTVLNEVLNYDKIEMKQLNLEFAIIPIWETVEKCANEFALSFQSKHIDFVLNFAPLLDNMAVDVEAVPPPDSDMTKTNKAKDLPSQVLQQRVIGDVSKITQVIRNLLSNALKFTPTKGKVALTVAWIKSETASPEKVDTFKLDHLKENVSFPRSGSVRLSVTDSGAGLSAEQLSALFQPGVQFHSNKLQGGNGSGLGLFISQGIIQRHGGTLRATSDGLGHGTTFELVLPLHRVSDESFLVDLQHTEVSDSFQMKGPIRSMTTGSARVSPKDDEPLRILIVDDVAMNRTLLSRLLTKRGHKCDEACDGMEAIDKVADSLDHGCSYDCILLDFEMDNVNGPTASKRMRQMNFNSLIIGITGNVLPADVKHFLDNGADWVLSKPIRMPDLDAIWLDCGLIRRGQGHAANNS